MKKYLIICADGPHHKYLINELVKSGLNIEGIVIELSNEKVKRLLNKKKYKVYLTNKYHEYRRKIVGSDRYRSNYFKTYLDPRVSKVKSIKVSSVNDKETIDFIKGVNPDCTIVMGTSILGKETINACNRYLINIHGGFLPYYKGNHCFFFALYNKEYDKIGSTIHFVNTGIDSGDIIEHVIPEIKVYDNAEKIYCRAEKKAIFRLIEILKAYDKGAEIKGTKQENKGKLYYTRDRRLRYDLKMLFRGKVKSSDIEKVR